MLFRLDKGDFVILNAIVWDRVSGRMLANTDQPFPNDYIIVNKTDIELY